MDIPKAFAHTMISLHGDAGRLWLDELPALLRECAERWSLTVQAPYPNLSYNYVALAEGRDGKPLALKLGVPNPELTSEISALRHYDGQAAVRLLRSDAERGILLMERLQPGRMLSSLKDDDSATLASASVIRGLWRPMPSGGLKQFRTVESWTKGLNRLRETFGGGCGPFPPHLVDRAEQLFDELLASSDAPILLHGDLHHYNILDAGSDKWLAIDPKGVIGEPCYEAGALMRNPYPQVTEWPNVRQALNRRADILAAELGFDRGRVIDWSMAQAVLAAWWTYEDDGTYDARWLVIAEALLPYG